jgi:peptidoglycan hydrolase-like protein with peptidoglycan-binding domain
VRRLIVAVIVAATVVMAIWGIAMAIWNVWTGDNGPTAAVVVSASNAPVRLGDSGPAVRAAQVALDLLGYPAGKADGRFAAATAAAAAAFQRDAGIPTNGAVGRRTAKALATRVARVSMNDRGVVTRGLHSAVADERVDRRVAAAAARSLEHAMKIIRAGNLAVAADVATALHLAAAQAGSYTTPRVRALFSQLTVNIRHAPAPMHPGDIEGPDGTVYRYMAGHGYQFHPLANFARLNRQVGGHDDRAARRLARALMARGVRQGDGLVWEYYFPFAGPSRWTSGFAQAVAADSLARAGKMLRDDGLRDAAHSAFVALDRGLVHPAGSGRWIVEYSYAGNMLVLNAHLESLLALNRYATTSGDPQVAALAAGFNRAAHELLGSFDTGCWSRYSLNGSPASSSYHAYHVQLLRRLFSTTGDRLWQRTAGRWAGYQRAPSC